MFIDFLRLVIGGNGTEGGLQAAGRCGFILAHGGGNEKGKKQWSVTSG